jgi:hypothetical protein
MRPFLLRLQLPNTSLNGGNVCLATLHSSDRDCTPHTTYVTLQDNSRTFSWLILPRRLQTLYMNTSLSKSKQTFYQDFILIATFHHRTFREHSSYSDPFSHSKQLVFSVNFVNIQVPFFAAYKLSPRTFREHSSNSDPFLHSKQLICAVNTVNI